MQRVIPITINIKTGTTDSQIMMYRGDNVKFQFNFTDTSSVSLDTATKLRVLVKPANDLKASYVWFSGEATITAEDYSIEFTSEQTSGYAGNGFLAVLVLDANNETVCTAGIPFRVEPSGYDGIYTPSEDFRDEVFAARDAAVAAADIAANQANLASTRATAAFDSANLASTKASQASSNAINAESSAQSAEASASIAAQKVSEAESAKNMANAAAGRASNSADNAAQSAQQAQQAAAQAVEITDPEGWRTDTRAMIARLALTKSDSGTLYCNGGFAKTNSAGFTTLSKASMLVRFARKNTTRSEKEYICNIGDGETVNTGISVVLLTDNRISVPLYLQKPDGTKFGTYISAFDASEYLDGKMHSLAVCLAGTSAKAYVDGVLKGSVSNLPSDTTIVASNINITLAARGATNSRYFYGQVSDFRVFNFDVSATDSPYTLADYQAGKRLPPFLSSGVYIKSNPDVDTQKTPPAGKLGQTTQGTLTKSDNGYTLTLTSASTRRFWFKFDKKYPAGTWFRVRRGALTWNGMETTPTRISQTALNVGTSTTSPYTTPVGNLPTSEAVDVVFQTPIEANMVGFVLWNGADVATATISIPYFEFEVLGASVALENCTIARNTTTKLIKDVSGNSNDATVSGNVMGDMDAGITAFVDELKTQISQNS